MSKKNIEDIHYYYARDSKEFEAYDIIDSRKTISILECNKKGDLSTYAVFDKKSKEKIRRLLKELRKVF